MTFLEHLNEFRGRLIICIGSIILTTVIGGVTLAKPVLNLLTLPFTRVDIAPVRQKGILTLVVQKDGSLQVANMDELTSGLIKSNSLKVMYPLEVDAETTKSRGLLDFARNLGETAEDPWEGYGSILISARAQTTLVARHPFAAFMAWIKVAMILGIVFALPIWMHQIWLFVAPALTRAERRVVRPVILAGVFLFPMGCTFAYGMLYIVMNFAVSYTRRFEGFLLWPDVDAYLRFVIHFMLVFGFVFETPLVILMLVRMRVVSTRTLRKSRSLVVVLIFVLSAVLTPQDPFTMIGMAIPMLALYEISLWIAAVVERKIEAAEKELDKTA
jgi:sec-independent protein translocase protein TatC